MISSPGSNSDITHQPDPNLILDVGYPRSVGGLASSFLFSLSLGINFNLESLYCEPFYRDYGKHRSEETLTIVICLLPVEYIISKKSTYSILHHEL